MNDNELNFHMEEFKQLKTELNSLGNMAISLVKYSLLGTVAIFSWLITQGLGIDSSKICLKIPSEILVFSWYLPLVFSSLAFVGAMVFLHRLFKIGGYLKILENALGNEKLGWEKYLSGNKTLLFGLVIFWFILIYANVWIAEKANTIVLSNNNHYCPASKSNN